MSRTYETNLSLIKKKKKFYRNTVYLYHECVMCIYGWRANTNYKKRLKRISFFPLASLSRSRVEKYIENLIGVE